MTDDRAMLEEMRQPYRTPAERAEDRKARGSGIGVGFTSQAERPEDAPAPATVMPVWLVMIWGNPDGVLIRCPSRSGSKIYANNTLGMKGVLLSRRLTPLEIPEDAEILTAVFETVPEFAARMEREKLEKKK